MSLHTKYRPETFDEVVGNREVIESLKYALALTDKPHAFLLTGPSGTGKTTLGRIIGKELKKNGVNGHIHNINSANYRGIDSIRQLDSMCDGFFFRVTQTFIFDECHQFTQDAQHALLKVVEDTPEDCYFVFCTTAPHKLLDTLRNRCYPYELKPVNCLEMRGLLEHIIKLEAIHMIDDIIDLVVLTSEGIPRQALINLGMVRGVGTFEKAVSLLCKK